MRGTTVLAVAMALAVMAFGAEAAQQDASQGDASESYDAAVENASATVTAQRGTTTVLLLDAEEWENTEIGRLYTSGSEFKTGARSYIEVELDEDNSFRIKGTTRVKVEKIFDAAEDATGNVIRLVELQVVDGEVNARLGRLPDDVRVKVTSPTAVAGASGTGFTFTFNKAELATLVEVTDSTVLVQAVDNADKAVAVHAYEQVEARRWKGGKLTATGRGVLSERVLGKAFVEQFRQQAGKRAVTAAGTAPAPAELADKAERRAESKQAALDAARAALTAIVLRLALDETTTVADVVTADRTLAAKLYRTVAAAPVLDAAFADDDSCTVTVQIDVAAIAEALGRRLNATIASVREMPEADYLDTFGAQALLSTKRAAETDARRRLAGKINGSIVAPGRTLEDEAKRNAQVRVTILGVVEGAIVEEEHYFSDGSITVLMSCMLGRIAENHPELVGETYLSSPEPAFFHDFMDYRIMRERARVPHGADGGAAAKVAKGKKKTQGQLAKDIVRMLGLDSQMPPNATDLDYIAFLSGQGWGPLPEWDPDGEATEEVVAVLMIQMLGWGSDVGNPHDPRSYMALLNARGLSLGNVRDILGNTDLLGQLMLWDPLSGPYQDNQTPVRGR